MMSNPLSLSNNDLNLIGIRLVGETAEPGLDVQQLGGQLVSVSLDSNTSGFSSCSTGIGKSSSSGDILGFVAIPSNGTYTLHEFRSQMVQQITSLPTNYVFLSREGWPVSLSQESMLYIRQVLSPRSIIFIRNQHEKRRFGVHIPDGRPIGFIFCDIKSKANLIKSLIAVELAAFLPHPSFILLDRNGWPVTVKQEDELDAFDLVNNGIFTIKTLKRALVVEDEEEEDQDQADGQLNDDIKFSPINSKPLIMADDDRDADDTDQDDPPTDNSTLAAKTSARNDSTFTDDDIPTLMSNSITSMGQYSDAPMPSNRIERLAAFKPILISYVRNEAEGHARSLKRSLSDIGCDVYLDVDEISPGSDWQDELNNAVRKCEIFVPLVTPRYGATLWTNREVKLADTMNKMIIPVNFSEYWPPDCLAIQFSSTQFLSWKEKEEIEEARAVQGDRADDIKYWDEPYVLRTAKQIKKISKHKLDSIGSTSRSISQLTDSSMVSSILGMPVLRHVPQMRSIMARPLIHEIKAREEDEDGDEVDEPITVKSEYPSTYGIEEIQRSSFGDLSAPPPYSLVTQPLIVIAAHPSERDFVEEISRQLNQMGYEVWSTIDMDIGQCSQMFGDDEVDDACKKSGSQSSSQCLTPVSVISAPGFPPSPESMAGIGQCPEIGSNSQDSVMSVDYVLKSSNGGTGAGTQQDRRRPRLNFSFSRNSDHRDSSQISDFGGSQTSVLSPEDQDKARTFKERVDRARVVLVVLSKAFTRCKTARSQAHYCEYRKSLIIVNYNNSRQLPHWCNEIAHGIEMIRRDSDESGDSLCFQNILRKVKIIMSMDPKDDFKKEMTEAKIQSLGGFLRGRLPRDWRKILVYVAGGTKFYNPLSEGICRAIGQVLATRDNIVVVTSGFYGAADTIGRSFQEERQALRPKAKDEHIYHVLPKKHDQDFSMKARQNSKTHLLSKVPYGGTEFVGDTVAERDAVVARLFNFCILVEGGPSSARLAQEFLYNDKIVIPVMCSGGAASGLFDTNVADMPAGVSREDWNTLSRRDMAADEIAASVLHVLLGLAKARTVNNRTSNKWSHHHMASRNFNRNRKGGHGGNGNQYKGNKKQTLVSQNSIC